MNYTSRRLSHQFVLLTCIVSLFFPQSSRPVPVVIMAPPAAAIVIPPMLAAAAKAGAVAVTIVGCAYSFFWGVSKELSDSNSTNTASNQDSCRSDPGVDLDSARDEIVPRTTTASQNDRCMCVCGCNFTCGCECGCGCGKTPHDGNKSNNPEQCDDKFVSDINQESTAILRNGYYEVNGFKFTKYYYERLWKNGRKAPSLVVQSILDHPESIVPDPMGYSGFYKYTADGWWMIYSPVTKIVSHLEPLG